MANPLIQAAHSKLGASSYERYKNCPGSIRESEGVKSVSSEHAQEGTRAHEVAELILIKKPVPRSVSLEMLEAVNVYTSFVQGFEELGWVLLVETKFDLTEYHPGLFGTADAVLYNEETKQLLVVDYKHGQGVSVDVKKDGKPNSQLMFYALGALHEMKLPVHGVTICIVQPRAYHVDGPIRSLNVDPMEVLEFSFELIKDALATEDPNAPLHAGSWCRWCPAQYKCPEVKNKALVQLKSPFSDLSTQYAPEELSKALNSLDMMEGYVKAVRAFAYQEAINGRVPPGFKLVDKRATRKWLDAESARTAILETYTISESLIFEAPKLKSPAQIEKLICKKAFSAIEYVVTQESSGKALVPISDSRKENAGNSSPFNALNEGQTDGQ